MNSYILETRHGSYVENKIVRIPPEIEACGNIFDKNILLPKQENTIIEA